MKTLYKITPIVLALFCCSSFFLIVGCASTSPGRLATPSGRPEVTIANTSAKTAMDGIIAWLPTQGKILSELTENAVGATFTQSVPALLRNFEYPAKSIYTLIPSGNNVILYEITFKKDSGDITYDYEVRTQSYYESMQNELVQLAEFIKTRSSSEITK
jgi:hypothetical protein